jgi:molecular chaperone GrpE
MRDRIKNFLHKMNTNESNPLEDGEESSMQDEQLVPETSAMSEEPLSPEQIDPELNETDGWKQKYQEMNDKYLRLYSEFDNFRKRSAREQVELRKTASADIFTAILPILDDFDRAAKAMESANEVSSVIEGMQLIHTKLWKIAESKGLEVMDASGQDFDADIHQAITSIPSPDPSMKGKVVDMLEKGYSLNGKVIRFAKVVVGG